MHGCPVDRGLPTGKTNKKNYFGPLSPVALKRFLVCFAGFVACLNRFIPICFILFSNGPVY